jgi:hypothetical protein
MPASLRNAGLLCLLHRGTLFVALGRPIVQNALPLVRDFLDRSLSDVTGRKT